MTADISRDLLGSGIFTPLRRISSRVIRKTTVKWTVASRAPSTREKTDVEGKGFVLWPLSVGSATCSGPSKGPGCDLGVPSI